MIPIGKLPQARSVLAALEADADPVIALLATEIRKSWKRDELDAQLTRLAGVAQDTGISTLRRVCAIFMLLHLLR